MLHEIERIRFDFLDRIFNLYTRLVDPRHGNSFSRSSNAAASSAPARSNVMEVQSSNSYAPKPCQPFATKSHGSNGQMHLRSIALEAVSKPSCVRIRLDSAAHPWPVAGVKRPFTKQGTEASCRFVAKSLGGPFEASVLRVRPKDDSSAAQKSETRFLESRWTVLRLDPTTADHVLRRGLSDFYKICHERT